MMTKRRIGRAPLSNSWASFFWLSDRVLLVMEQESILKWFQWWLNKAVIAVEIGFFFLPARSINREVILVSSP
jgi:hypothetical protein